MSLRLTVTKVVDWLRQGYPQGVPQADYVALLGILRRELEPDEIEYVAEQVAVSGETVSRETIRRALENQSLQQASVADIQRVSAALAEGGWPLGAIDLSEADHDENGRDAKPNPVVRFVNWIRVGYPAGVPDQDFQPLIALLHHRLPDEQVDAVCDALLHAGLIPPNRVDVGVEVSKVLDQLPSDSEIARVIEKLRAAGWPVDESNAEMS